MDVVQRRIPHDLDLVIGFVNTYEPEEGIDSLATLPLLQAWLIRHDLLSPAHASLTAAQHMRAIALREALRAMMAANNGGPQDAQAADQASRAAERGALSMRFTQDGSVVIAPRAAGFDGAIARLLIPVCLAALDGSWRRVKACREPACHEAFFDHSRNRSAVWCDMALCGNRTKVRTYRARSRDDGPRR